MAVARLTMSLTETEQFRRLVDFVGEVYDYAQLTSDEELAEKVRVLRDDLALVGKGREWDS